MRDIIQKYSPVSDMICCIGSIMLSCLFGTIGAIVSEVWLFKLFPARVRINELVAIVICIACFAISMRISISVMTKWGVEIKRNK